MNKNLSEEDKAFCIRELRILYEQLEMVVSNCYEYLEEHEDLYLAIFNAYKELGDNDDI